MIIINFLFFALFCIVLFASGVVLVESLSKIARFLRITEFTAAFIIMAIATSLPELFVGISSALEKSPLLSLGNIIGANILNLTLVTGLIILASRGLKIKSKETKKDALLMLIPVAALIILSFIGNSLSRIDGAILVCMFFIYSYRLIKKRKQEFKEKLENEIKRYEIVINSMLFVVSLLLMFYSSKLVVHYAILLSQALKVPTIVIGLFLISIGTVLPELTFGISAALKNKGEMALGDQIGTIVVNSTFIIGIVAIIQPITTSMIIFMISAAFLLFSAFIFATFFQVSRKLYVIEAIALIFLYLLFVFVEVYARFL
jgi:cation:H+ antiporter